MRWRQFLFVALSISSAAFVIGLVVEGFWGGGPDGKTNWVDQSFGFVMYLGGALTILFGILLLASLIVTGALRLIRIGGTRRRAT